MPPILGSKTVTVAVLTVLLAGDLVRYALTVPVWAALVILSAVWALAVLWTSRVGWRQLPLPLTVAMCWWVLTPAWSPYAASSLLMLIPGFITLIIGVALVTAVPLDEFIRRGALVLRSVLAGSVLFEVAVALYGHAVYPVGAAVTPNTPIEMAWSRALFFVPGARIQGLVGNANLLGMLALVLLIIAVWRMFASRNWRTISLFDAIVSSFILVRTLSATVTVALIIVVVAVGLAALARRTGRGWRVGFVAALVSIMTGVGVAIAMWPTVAGLLGKSPDMTHRFDIWRAVAERIADRPLVGHGYVGWWPSWEPWFAIHTIDGVPMLQAHNVWLDLTMQTGMVGAVAFAVALVGIVWMLWRAFVESPRSVAAVPFLVMVALTVQSFSESRMLIEWGFASVVAFGVVAERFRRGFIAPPK